jgi:hypothetical protein
VIEIHEGVSGPERLAKLLSGDYVASSLHKRGQNLQTLLLESDADTVLVHSPARRSTSKSPKRMVRDYGSAAFMKTPESLGESVPLHYLHLRLNP